MIPERLRVDGSGTISLPSTLFCSLAFLFSKLRRPDFSQARIVVIPICLILDSDPSAVLSCAVLRAVPFPTVSVIPFFADAFSTETASIRVF